MNEFKYKIDEFYNNLGTARKMVLATSKNNRVTARTMSCIITDGFIFFQTDKKLIKYEQITANPMVALCTENIQIEGTAAVLGHPLKNPLFSVAFEAHFNSSYQLYTALHDEVLIKVQPKKITLWIYENKLPYRVFFDIEKQTVWKEYYSG